jgi:hypothetical protein
MAFCLSLALLMPAWAGDGALDPSFNPGAGVTKIPVLRGQSEWINNTVTPNVPTGVSLIYGYFNQIADSSHTYSFNSLAKMNDTSGTIDPNFHFPINGPDGTGVGDVRFAVVTIQTSSTCDIIIGGSFSLVAPDSSTYYNLARLKNSGGTWVVDTTFPHLFNQGGLVSGFALTGTYQSSGSYILVGGYDLKLNVATQGDTNVAHQLIRLAVSSGDYIYDPNYTTRHTPGTMVSSIQYRSTDTQYPGAAFIFGTFPQRDGSVHWVEVLSSDDLSTVVASLGSNQFDGPIYNFATFPAAPYSRVFVGSFKNATFGGITTSLNRIAQVKADLSGLDNTANFNTNINTLGGANLAVQQILMQGSQPVIAGSFTSFNGTNYGHLVRLLSGSTTSGMVDTSFNYSGSPPVPNAGADDHIFRIYRPLNQPTLQILGSFQTYNGSANPRHCIANLNGATGAVNSAYAAVNPTTTGSAAIGTVYAIGEIWGNEGTNWWNYLVIGGDFTGVNGKFNKNLAFLNKDGTLPDRNGGSTEGTVKSIRGLGDGSVVIAGNFGYSLGVGCTGLLHLTSEGRADYTVRPVITKADGTVADLHNTDMNEDVSDKLAIMGKFAYVYDSSGTPRSRTAFALLNSDGSLDTYTPSFQIPNSSNIHVNTGGSMGGGRYGMGGYYQNTNDNSDCGFVCVLDEFGNQTNLLTFNGEVTSGAGSESSIVLAGKFTQVTYPVQATRNHIAAITSSFTLASSFAGDGTDGPILAMQTQGENDTGNILIGGNFTSYNGVARKNLARLLRNGDLDTSFNPGTGPNGTVYDIRWTQWGTNGRTSGKALIGGAFTSYNGTFIPGIAQVFASQANFSPGVLWLLLDN